MFHCVPRVQAGVVGEEDGGGAVEGLVGLVEARLEGLLGHDEDHHGEEEVHEAHHDDEAALAALFHLEVEPVQREEDAVGEEDDEEAPDQGQVDLVGDHGRAEGAVGLGQQVDEQGVEAEVQQPLVLRVEPTSNRDTIGTVNMTGIF